jgi:hypothetical protein
MSPKTVLTNTFRKAKRALTCTAVIAGVVISGSVLTSEMRGQKNATPTSSPSSLTPEQAAKQFWGSILTQCGDSYYEGVLYDGIRRYKQPSFHPVQLGDPIKGLEATGGHFRWRGYTNLTGKTYKSYSKEKGWGEWIDAYTDRPVNAASTPPGAGKEYSFLKMEMKNWDGHWSFDVYDFRLGVNNGVPSVDLSPLTVLRRGSQSGPVPFEKPTCVQIPGTAEYETQVTQKQ